jgi:hypothetical protein
MAEQQKEQKSPNYPKVLYHRSLAPVTVENEEEHQEYPPEEWAETPTAFDEKPASKTKKKADAPAN